MPLDTDDGSKPSPIAGGDVFLQMILGVLLVTVFIGLTIWVCAGR